MLRVFSEKGLKQRRCFLFVRMSFVRRRCTGYQCQCVKDLALDIVGIAFGELAHRCGIAINAVAVRR